MQELSNGNGVACEDGVAELAGRLEQVWRGENRQPSQVLIRRSQLYRAVVDEAIG